MILSISPAVRGALKVCALAASTIHYFAVVIVLPMLNQSLGQLLSYFEVAVVIVSYTAGVLFAYNWAYWIAKKYGTHALLNAGFAILTGASFALWAITISQASANNYANLLFVARLTGGVGAGLLNAACLITRGEKVVGSQSELESAARSSFMTHYAGEALGYLLGPVLILICSDTERTYNTFFWQAIFVSCVWLISASLMLVDFCSNRGDDRQETEQTLMELEGSFIRSLLYNQVPLRSFYNPVTILALLALSVEWILATYFYSVFSIIAENPVKVVAAQVVTAMALSAGVIFLSNLVMKGQTAPKVVTFLAFGSTALGCGLMHLQAQNSLEQVQPAGYFDFALVSFSLISASATMLTQACFTETQNGVNARLARSRWHLMAKEQGGMLVYVESACLCQGFQQTALILGPMLGGAMVNRPLSIARTTELMTYFAVATAVTYLIGSFLVRRLEKNEAEQPVEVKQYDWHKKHDDLASWINRFAGKEPTVETTEARQRSERAESEESDRLI